MVEKLPDKVNFIYFGRDSWQRIIQTKFTYSSQWLDSTQIQFNADAIQMQFIRNSNSIHLRLCWFSFKSNFTKKEK